MAIIGRQLGHAFGRGYSLARSGILRNIRNGVLVSHVELLQDQVKVYSFWQPYGSPTLAKSSASQMCQKQMQGFREKTENRTAVATHGYFSVTSPTNRVKEAEQLLPGTYVVDSNIGLRHAQRSCMVHLAPVSTKAPFNKEADTSAEQVPGSQRSRGHMQNVSPSEPAEPILKDRASATQGPEFREAIMGSARDQSKSSNDPSSDCAVEVADFTDRGLWGYFQDLYSSIKMEFYMLFHKTNVEKNFDMEEFIEGVKHSYDVVYRASWNGDFESLAAMTSTPYVNRWKKEREALCKSGYSLMTSCVEEIHEVKLVDFDFKFEEKGSGYGLLDKVTPIPNYHDNLFFQLAVRVRSDVRYKYYGVNGNMVLNLLVKKWRHLHFVRQLPQIPTWMQPVDELESPWFLVDMDIVDRP